jgi:hypothetical protein
MTRLHFLNSTALALACALSLAACNKQDASTTAADSPLPLTNGPQTAIVAAPASEALPAATRPAIAASTSPQDDDYSYVDRAYAMSDAIGDAPPDYGFDYRDTHPWVWRSTNRSMRLVEPVSGGYRDYYYQPGADRPYLVRDPQYAYGFSNGELAAVYDRNGRLLPYQDLDQRDDDAGRILARAMALYGAALQSERRPINAANWAAQQGALAHARGQWQAEQTQQDSWHAYHAAHAAQDQDDWKAERVRRDQSAQSFRDWKARGYSGPPPPVTYVNRSNAQQDQARAQQQQADQARQQQDAARQGQARQQQQQQDQARQQQDAAQQAQDKARQKQQQDQARQQHDAAQQAQDKARQKQQQDQARQQHDAAQQTQDKARQEQQSDKARAQQAQGSVPRGHRTNEAPAPRVVAPVAATPAAAVVPPAVALPANRKAQQEAGRLAKKKRADDAQARDGKPPQP